ncbi:MAG: NAD(P)-dependent oxidoreductase [Gammaproteobacteria bacterium]
MIKKSTLPVLEAIMGAVEKTGMPEMKNTLFVCVQHLLHTSVNLFETLICLGAPPKNIFLIGKHYSTCPAVVEKLSSLDIQIQNLTPLQSLGEYSEIFKKDIENMWQQVQHHIECYPIDSIIVLDDGGRCLELIPESLRITLPIIGIEQTTAGFFNPAVTNSGIPLIDVAMCAAKTHIESEMIIDSIIDKLGNALPKESQNFTCGVVGLGVIGKAVARKLITLGYQVLLHDQVEKNSKIEGGVWLNTLDELFHKADYIFGCTGRDITTALLLETCFNRDKIFISCTSEDKEFLSLLKKIQIANNSNLALDPLADIRWQLPNQKHITLLKGGFPINFDFSGEAVTSDKIQLTRGLLLCALIQALMLFPKISPSKNRIMLSPSMQQFVITEWLTANPVHSFHPELLRKFENYEWVTENSNGNLYEDGAISRYFNFHREV